MDAAGAFTAPKSNGVPIDHLEFAYISKCTNGNELEKIVKRLRSGEDGHFPELLASAEKQLAKYKPKSTVLMKSKREVRQSDLDPEKRTEIEDEMKSWEREMKETDARLKSRGPSGQRFQPIRKPAPVEVERSGKEKGEEEEEEDRARRIKSSDYRAWDKVDVIEMEKEIEEMEEKKKAKKKSQEETTEIPTKLPIPTDPTERQVMAQREKAKGNDSFRAGNYSESITYYTRSIDLDPLAVSYNNRAMAYIKTKKYEEALKDVDEVLKIEPDNRKALHRRAQCYRWKGRYDEAEADLERVLEAEPNHTQVTALLKEVRAKKTTEVKRKRVNIVEVDDDDEEEEEEEKEGVEIPPTEPSPPPPAPSPPDDSIPPPVLPSPSPPPPPAPAPLPESVIAPKNRGYEMFRNGDYSKALDNYNEAIEALEPTRGDFKDAYASLLNNRAACHHRLGDCRSCIKDCDEGLSFNPKHAKLFMRRAFAYEALEKYGRAYVDFKAAAEIDSSLAPARQACSRMGAVLSDKYSNWRERLNDILDKEDGKEKGASDEDQKKDTRREKEEKGASSEKEEEEGEMKDGPRDEEKDVSSEETPKENGLNEETPMDTQEDEPAAAPPPSPPEEPATYESMKIKGNQFVRESRFDEALACYSECIRLDSSQLAPYTNRALCHLKLKKFALAVEDCDSALRLDEKNVKALFRRAQANSNLTEYRSALMDLTALLKIEPNNSLAQKEMEKIKGLWRMELKESQEKFAKQQEKENKEKKPEEKKSESSTKPIPIPQKKRQEKSPPAPPNKTPAKSKTPPRRPPLSSARRRQAKKEPKRVRVAIEEGSSSSEEDQTANPKESGTAASPSTETGAEPAKKTPTVPTVPTPPAPSPPPASPPPPAPSPPPASPPPRLPDDDDVVEKKVVVVEPASVRASLSYPDFVLEKGTPYEFIQAWQSVRARPGIEIGAQYASLLKQVKPENLPSIISNKLEGEMLAKILDATANYLVPEGELSLSLQLLNNLAKVKRFDFVSMFLNSKDKQNLHKVLKGLESESDVVVVAKADLEKLKKSYKV
ncbi:sperm-associated antigen 1-like isoform X2 [Oscarella lobularis]|uniref:sperm-associated antigen 1-like isoform X2 n=1 Tax=Oscarella lobularis TaxID=121494 RepID=UPI003313756B